MNDRNDRNIRFFGADGQAAIERKKVVIIGSGGLGAAVAQDLAYLGVKDYALVDGDVVTITSLNRLKGATARDVGEKKVFVAKRMIEAIQPTAMVTAIPAWIADVPDAVADANVAFACLDRDIDRIEVIKQCTAAGVPFFDLATDVINRDGTLVYGGRVLWSGNAERCPLCMDLLDQDAMRRDSLPAKARPDYDKIYGVPKDDLDDAGPSVVSLNSVVAGAAVTEFMVWATGIREPQPLLTYRADLGPMRANLDASAEDCPYCSAARRRAA